MRILSLASCILSVAFISGQHAWFDTPFLDVYGSYLAWLGIAQFVTLLVFRNRRVWQQTSRSCSAGEA